MPKVHDTRKQKAAQLLARLKEGPCFDHDFDSCVSTVAIEVRAKQSFKLWAETWVIPAVMDLVPELRKSKVESVKQRSRE